MEWIDEWMDEWTSEWIDSGRLNEWIEPDRQTSKSLYFCHVFERQKV